MVSISRRSFLSSIIAAAVAPAIVRSGLIMPIKPPLVLGPPFITALLQKRILEAREIMAANILNNVWEVGNIDNASRANWEASMRAGEALLGLKRGFQEGQIVRFERGA